MRDPGRGTGRGTKVSAIGELMRAGLGRALYAGAGMGNCIGQCAAECVHRARTVFCFSSACASKRGASIHSCLPELVFKGTPLRAHLGP